MSQPTCDAGGNAGESEGDAPGPWKLVIALKEFQGLFSIDPSKLEPGDGEMLTKVSIVTPDVKRTVVESEAISTKITKKEEEKKEEKKDEDPQNYLKFLDAKLDFKAETSVDDGGRTALLDTLYSDPIQIRLSEAIGGEVKSVGTLSISADELVQNTTELKGWHTLTLTKEAKEFLGASPVVPGAEKKFPRVYVEITVNKPLLSAEEKKTSNILVVKAEGVYNLPAKWSEPVAEEDKQDITLSYNVPLGRKFSFSAPKPTSPEPGGDGNDDGDEEKFEVVSEKAADLKTRPYISFNLTRRFHLSQAVTRIVTGMDYLSFRIKSKVEAGEEVKWSQTAGGRLSLRSMSIPGVTSTGGDVALRGISSSPEDLERKDDWADKMFVRVSVSVSKPLVPKFKEIDVNNILPKTEAKKKEKSKDVITIQDKISGILQAASLSEDLTGNIDAFRFTDRYQQLYHEMCCALVGEVQRQFRWRHNQEGSVSAEANKTERSITNEELKAVLADIRKQALEREVPLADREGDVHRRVALLRNRARSAETHGDLHIAYSAYLERLSVLDNTDVLHDDDLKELQALCWFDLGAFCARGVGSSPFHDLAYKNKKGQIKPKGDLDHAVGCFRKALSFDGMCVPALLGIASVLCELDDVEGALVFAKKANTLMPDHALTIGLMYMVMDLLEDDEEADKCFEALMNSLQRESYNTDGTKREVKARESPTALHPDDWDLVDPYFKLGTEDRYEGTLFLTRYLGTLKLTRLSTHILAKLWEPASPRFVEGSKKFTPETPTENVPQQTMLWAEVANVWGLSGQQKWARSLLKHISTNLLGKSPSLTDESTCGKTAQAVGYCRLGLCLAASNADELSISEQALLTSLKNKPTEKARLALVDVQFRSCQFVKAVETLKSCRETSYTLALQSLALMAAISAASEKKEKEEGEKKEDLKAPAKKEDGDSEDFIAHHLAARATTLDPSNPVAWCACALAALKKSCFKEASECLDMAYERQLFGPAWVLKTIAESALELKEYGE